jgi:O-antigen/teichoic acid export membrane protein
MSKTHKKQLVSGIFWFIIGQLGYLTIGLISNIILARLLTVYEFGQMGIVLFFILVARVLTDAGLGGALVRNNNATQKDYSTIFLFNLLISFFLMVVIMLSANSIATYYGDHELKNILIASSLIIIINAFQLVQAARLVKNMEFRKKASYDFIAILIASIVAIIFANNGFGVWSIVILQLLLSLFQSTLYWAFEGGVGPWVFNKDSFKLHYKFGVNTTIASILNTVFDNIYQLILGKYFAISQTGLFYQAKKLQAVPVGVIEKVVQSVVFSSLSKIQENEAEFKKYYQKIVTMFTISSGLICLLVFLFAENLISILYGEKWLGATFFMKILILSSFFYLQESFNRVIFKVYDRTEVILKLEFVKKSIQILSILIGLYYLSLEILLYGFLVTSIISYYINYVKSRIIFKSLGWYELKVLCIVIGVSLILCGTALYLNLKLGNSNIISLLYAPLIGILYLLCLWAIGILNPVNNYKELKKLLRNE